MLDAMDLSTVQAHQLGPLAVKRWSETGRDVPAALLRERRVAHVLPLMATQVMKRARDAYTGRMLLIKGPEIAALYPADARLYGDLDVFVDDPQAAYDALLAAGFERDAETETRPHHFPSLLWPGVGLPIEIHTQLAWPRHLEPPRNEELFAEAVPSSLAVAGLETASPVHHAVLVAAHGWKHMPLSFMRDLIDVAVLAEQSDRAELERVARSWGVERIWQTAYATANWLFAGGRRPVATRLWARSLHGPREETILERHVRRWVTPFWALPLPRATVAAAKNVALDIRPGDGDSWRAKLRRTATVATHPSRTRSEVAWDDEDEL
jgi:hypothetical protein